MPNTFGFRLAAAMKAAKLRTADVAAICGVSARTVRRWLQLRDAPLVVLHMACIAESTGADLRQLVTGGDKFRSRRKYSARRGHFWPRKRAILPNLKSSA